MKCPYCGKEMSKGYIRNPRGVIAWTPEGEKANVMQSKAKEYQIELGEHSGIGVTTVEAEYCDVDGIFLIRQKK